MRGSYILLMKLNDNKEIIFGKNNQFLFKKGFYIYVGSALNGLVQRINRHLTKSKKTHWHIDYFLKHTKIIAIYYKKNKIKEECIIANKLKNKLILIPKFGCSDCNCKTHLFYGSYKNIISSMKNLKMKRYNF